MSAVDPISDDAGIYSRRRILAVGGFSVGLAAVVAACAPDRPKPQVPQAGVAPTTTALPEQNVNDVVLLRTASSLEHSIAAAYAKVLALNVLPAETAALVRRFAEQHTDRAVNFEALTRDNGGPPYSSGNEQFDDKVLNPALKSIADAGNQPADLNWFVYGCENVATGTMQSFVPILRVPTLRSAVMAAGGAEARTSAIAATLIPTVTVVPPTATEEAAAAAVATTTTTVAGATTTTTPAAQLIPVAQVPGSFGSQTAVSVAIANKEEAWNLLGPNSYVYVEDTTTTTTG